MEWSGWNSAARSYLEAAGKELDVQEFVQDYLALASQFRTWLEGAIEEYHRVELEELAVLHSEATAAQGEAQATPAAVPEQAASSPDAGSPFTAARSEDLDAFAVELFEKVCELDLAKPDSGFPREREAITITEQQLTGPYLHWSQARDGTPVLAFVRHEGRSFGFVQDDYESLENFAARVGKLPGVRDTLSDEFTERVFLDWARARFHAKASTPFSTALENAVRAEVMPVEVWAPIAYMEVEEGFSFGPACVEPVTTGLMDRLEAKVHSDDPEQQINIARWLDDMKRKFKGSAAVLITLTAEPKMAQDRALRLAEDVVGLLRFFSPAASNANLFSPVSLNGSEHIPIARLILLQETGVIYSEDVLPKRLAPWRLSSRQISRLNTDEFAAAASLIDSTGLSDFALRVRAGVLAYSRSATLIDPLDRLRNCVAAVEGVFLKHELEPRGHTVANRMALAVRTPEEREALRKTVRNVYWLQGQPSKGRLQRDEQELMFAFTAYAHVALRMALANIGNFASTSDFLDKVDHSCVNTTES